ncbi:hypothetical protein S83_046988 [Arachis hypogaea]
MPTLPFLEIRLGLQCEQPLTPFSRSCFKVWVSVSTSPVSAQPHRHRRNNHCKDNVRGTQLRESPLLLSLSSSSDFVVVITVCFYSPGKPFPPFHRLEGIFGRDRATGAAAVSGFDAKEQVNEETEDTAVRFGESDMSPHPDNDGGPAMQGQASHSEAGASVGSTRRYGKKRKQLDVLERMADHIQQSSADQRKNAQLIADAIVGVNEKWKVGERLTQLGFGDDVVVRAILKFAESPNVYAHFWGLSNSQMIGLVLSII